MPLKLIIQNLIWDFLFFVRDITKNNSVFTLTISSGRVSLEPFYKISQDIKYHVISYLSLSFINLNIS